jgi:hypothetical protein
VGLGRAGGDHQPLGDLAVREPSRHEPQDFVLALAERRGERRSGSFDGAWRVIERRVDRAQQRRDIASERRD